MSTRVVGSLMMLLLLLALLVFLGVHEGDALEAEPDSSHRRLMQTIADVVSRRKEEKQELRKIPGSPWVDYPLFHQAPETSFSCARVPALPGMYADVETGCQVYHVCHDGREGEQGATFLCANGTIFNQQQFNCDWWYNVDCANAPSYYHLNLDPETNPYVPAAHKEYIRREKMRIVVV